MRLRLPELPRTELVRLSAVAALRRDFAVGGTRHCANHATLVDEPLSLD